MQFLPRLAPLLPRYDGLILDLWGVIHDGTSLYPGAKACLESLIAADKRIVFMSNAPRRAAKVIEVLERLGIGAHLYHHVISSGDVTYHWLSRQAPLRYYFLGPARDLGLADGLPHQRVERLEDAEILLNVGFERDDQPYEELAPLMEAGARRNLRMLCVNPDLEVVKLTGERLLCAGYSAREYEKLGGEVLYFGKPHPAIYETAFAAFGDIPRHRLLAVGDGLYTDIKGARTAGVECALVTGGLLKEMLGTNDFSDETQAKIRATCSETGVSPDFVMQAFS